MSAGECLFRLDAATPDEVAPALAFCFQVGRECLRRAADGIDGRGIEFGADLRLGKDVARCAGEALDDRRRRARRAKKPKSLVAW